MVTNSLWNWSETELARKLSSSSSSPCNVTPLTARTLRLDGKQKPNSDFWLSNRPSGRQPEQSTRQKTTITKLWFGVGVPGKAQMKLGEGFQIGESSNESYRMRSYNPNSCYYRPPWNHFSGKINSISGLPTLKLILKLHHSTDYSLILKPNPKPNAKVNKKNKMQKFFNNFSS